MDPSQPARTADHSGQLPAHTTHHLAKSIPHIRDFLNGFTITHGTETFPAHKWVLACDSTWFATWLKDNPKTETIDLTKAISEACLIKYSPYNWKESEYSQHARPENWKSLFRRQAERLELLEDLILQAPGWAAAWFTQDSTLGTETVDSMSSYWLGNMVG